MEEIFDSCSIISHFSVENEGYATILIEGKEVKIKGDRIMIENLISLIETNSKQIIKS